MSCYDMYVDLFVCLDILCMIVRNMYLFGQVFCIWLNIGPDHMYTYSHYSCVTDMVYSVIIFTCHLAVSNK